MKIPKYKFVYDRRHTATSKKKASVDFVVTYNYKQKYISTGVSLLPQNWNVKLSKVMKLENAVSLNEQLKMFMDRAEEIINDMVKKERVDLDMLVNALQNKGTVDITFDEYVRDRGAKKPVRESTRKRYWCFLSILKKYREHVYFDDIRTGVRFVRDYDEWLHSQGYEQSTVATHHKYMKQFIADAIVDGYLDRNPYHDRAVKIDKGEKEFVDCIEEKQLRKLMKLKPDTLYLTHARDIFVFMAFTGMSYSDAMEFDMSEAQSSDGRWIYQGERHKNGVKFTVVLLPEAIGVLRTYGDSLPKMSNQKLNEYLKVLGLMIGVPELHSHQARGTFATMALDKGVPADVLKRMLGHKKTMQTLRYARVLNSTIAREMGKMG